MNISQVEQYLDTEFQQFKIGQKKFPLLFQNGVADAAVHSAGLGYLLSLGLNYGLSAIPEYPITTHSLSEWKDAGRVYPDSIWFHPETLKPWVAFEFERFERGDENKIRSKVENLAISYYQSGRTIELCVFIYWLRSSLAPKSIEPLFKAFTKGFTRQRIKIPPPNCKLLVYKVVMRQVEEQPLKQNIMLKELPAPYETLPGNKDLLVLDKAQKIGG